LNPNSEVGNEIESTCREPIVGRARQTFEIKKTPIHQSKKSACFPNPIAPVLNAIPAFLHPC
jgi:hypothetical protein